MKASNTRGVALVLAVAALLLLTVAALLSAQSPEPRLSRLADAARSRVESLLAEARAAGLPSEPLVDRALEGTAKGAAAPAIVAAVTRLRDELTSARKAFGGAATEAELVAGASALRAGATQADLDQLHQLRGNRPLTVAAAVLADLVSAGVPADTAVGAVLALATNAADADYIAFRRNVQRDVALGASPTAALGVRLAAAGDLASAPGQPTGGGTGQESVRSKRKP